MTQTNSHCTNKAKDLWQIFSKKESSFSTEPIKTIKTNVQLRNIRLSLSIAPGTLSSDEKKKPKKQNFVICTRNEQNDKMTAENVEN